MKNNKKMSKGITLIALVVTIIVLLILAGISIMMLTGDNGILKRAGEAKEKSIEAQIIDEITLAINTLKIDYCADLSINSNQTFREYVLAHKTDLAKSLGVDENEIEIDAVVGRIIYKGIMFDLFDNGIIRKTTEIVLSVNNLALEIIDGVGTEETLSAVLIGINGDISWSTSDDSIVTVIDGKVTATGEGTAYIIARCGTEESNPCEVIVSKRTSISSITISNAPTEMEEEEAISIYLTVNPENATEKPQWSVMGAATITPSEDGKSATIQANSIPSGSTTTSATITVTGTKNGVQDTCTIMIKKATYKNLVKNYRTTEEWELLYNGKVDPDGEERVYLIMKGSLSSGSLQIAGYNGTTDFVTKLTGNETEVEKRTKEAALVAFNTKYPAITQGLLYKTYSNGIIRQTNIKPNMKATQYLLNSSLSKWATYKDIVSDMHPNQFAEYVIGGPTLELLIASYNSRQTSDDDRVTIPNPNNYGYSRSGETALPSISLPENSDGSNPWNHGNSVMYWLASPSSNYQGNAMNYILPSGKIRCDTRYDATHNFRPVVCLKSNYTVKKNGSGWIIVEKN